MHHAIRFMSKDECDNVKDVDVFIKGAKMQREQQWDDKICEIEEAGMLGNSRRHELRLSIRNVEDSHGGSSSQETRNKVE